MAGIKNKKAFSSLGGEDNSPLVAVSFTGDDFYLDDVGFSVVPLPAAVWLFGSGLLGLVGLARTRRM